MWRRLLIQIKEPGVGEVADGISGCDGSDGLNNGIQKGINRLSMKPTQDAFDFGKRIFNGREVRRIRWQKQNLTAMIGEHLYHNRRMVNAQIVQNDDVASTQRRQ